ncbi:MAG: ECF transporter S component [Clostridia bacterium]|nr:ECF transporter S component [Clostridia bacterium]
MKTKRLITISLFAAITCVATMAIRIPSGLSGGYVNMGDCVVLLSAYILGPLNGAIAAGIGSCLADIFAGYTSFAIPTLVIKFLVALVAGLMFSKAFRTKSWLILIVSGVAGEIIMAGGYFLVEIWLSGSVAAAAAGIYGSVIQSVFGIIASTVLYKALTANVSVKRYIDSI